MRQLPPLNSLKAFEAVARLGTVVRAADELCVSHGAVSKQLAVLRDWVGVALFHRQAAGLRLTAAGEELLQEVQPALDRMAYGAAKIARHRTVRPLSVSAPPTMTLHWLLPRLTGFLVQHPEVRIQLNNRRAAGDALPAGVEFMVRRGLSRAPGLFQVSFMEERVTPVAAPRLLAGAGVSAPADLARLPWLVADMRGGDWPAWLQFAGQPGLAAGTSLHFDHTYLALEAARDGLGVAMAPLCLLQSDMDAGELVAPFPGLVMPAAPYVLAYEERLRKDAAVAAFHAWLVAEGARHEALRPGPGGPQREALDGR